MTMEKLPLTSHLIELRKRLMSSVIVLGVLFTVAFTFSEDIFRVLIMPMNSDMVFSTTPPFLNLVPRTEGLTKLVFLAPAEAFWAHMKIAMIAALVAGVPFLLFELWRFIAPGLKPNERRYALPFVVIGTGLFFVGALFCFFIILPFAMRFLLTYKTESMTAMITVQSYIDFCLKFVLAFGLIFELPIVILFLTRMGIVKTDTLARNRKYAALIAFIAAAFLTPTPDAFNQILMAVPIIVLYEAGILASRIFNPGRKEETA